MSSMHPGFSIGGRWRLSYRLVAIVLSVLCVLLNTGQTIGLTLFLGSFSGLTGVYFVVFFGAFCFGVVSSVFACWFGYKNQISRSMREWRWTKYMMYVSIFDAANAILTTFSSHGSRVPPALISILSQVTIPFTFMLSKWLLKKKYLWLHVLGVCLVVIGVAFSLIPIFKRMHDGTTETQLKEGWWWPFLFIVGCIPSAMKTIIQERLQVKFTESAIARGESMTRFSVMYFQAVETMFQVLLIAALFSLDLIPNFGTSSNVGEWWRSFSSGFECFFNVGTVEGGRCEAALGTGLLFIVTCFLASTVGTFLTDHISANWVAIVSSISPLLSTSFWFIFPWINDWAGVGETDGWDIGFSLGALPIIFVGMVLYQRAGTDRESEELIPLIEKHPTEFLW